MILLPLTTNAWWPWMLPSVNFIIVMICSRWAACSASKARQWAQKQPWPRPLKLGWMTPQQMSSCCPEMHLAKKSCQSSTEWVLRHHMRVEPGARFSSLSFLASFVVARSGPRNIHTNDVCQAPHPVSPGRASKAKQKKVHGFPSGLLLAAAAALSPKLVSSFPSWFAATLSSKLVSLRDFPSGLLLAAAAALSPKLVSLHDCLSGLLLVAAATFSSKLVPLHDFPSGLLLAAAAALSPKLVSLHDFPSGAALGCRCHRDCSWFPFWASPGYSCCPLSQASLPPPWFPFWAALGYSRRIPSLSPFSLRCLRLPPCVPSLSSSFLLGGCWQLLSCLPVLSNFSPFMILYIYIYLWFLCLSMRS